jgi:hypothetical protein
VQLDREAEDLIRGLLTWDPQQRLGSAGVHQIQRHPFFATIPWGSLEAEVKRDQEVYEELRAEQLQQEADAAAAAGGNGSGSSGGSYGRYDSGGIAEAQQYSLMQGQGSEASRHDSPATRW